jgi:hypothetical protein
LKIDNYLFRILKKISVEVSYSLPLIDYVRPYLLFIGEQSAR